MIVTRQPLREFQPSAAGGSEGQFGVAEGTDKPARHFCAGSVRLAADLQPRIVRRPFRDAIGERHRPGGGHDREGGEPVGVGSPRGARLKPDWEGVVLRHAEEGQTSADIAATLGLSEGTVRNYLSEAISKLGVANRIEAARLARQKGWL